MSDKNMQDIVTRIREKYPGAYDNIDDATLYGAIIKKYPVYSKSQKSEGLLQNAVKGMRALVPQSGEELGDVARMAGRQIPMARGGAVNPMTMGPFGAGLNIAGVKEVGPTIGEPKTEWGRVMEGQVVDPAMIAIPSSIGGKRLLQAGGKGVASLFDVKGAKAKVSSTAGRSAEKAKTAIKTMGEDANVAMGKSLQSLEKTEVTGSTFNEALRKTAFELDPSGTTHNMPGSASNKVLSLMQEGDNAPLSGPQVQAALVNMKNNLGFNSKAQASFNNFFTELLPESLKNIKATRAGVYAASDAAKPLTKVGTLRRVAGKGMDAEELAGLEKAQSGVKGLDVLNEMIKTGKGVSRAQTAQKLGGFAGKAALYGGGGLYALKRLMSGLGG